MRFAELTTLEVRNHLRIPKEQPMRLLQVLAVTLLSTVFLYGQPSPTAPEKPTELPKLEPFDVKIADPEIKPCDDFFKHRRCHLVETPDQLLGYNARCSLFANHASVHGNGGRKEGLPTDVRGG